MNNRKKAFTLTELLVVVVVLGVLAAVCAPKFTRALETRKTAEAENMLEAVRVEQEQRCVFGKNYQADLSALKTVASAQNSALYEYHLLPSGAEAASRGQDYLLRMPSYQSGRLCCEGSYCAKLNKDYAPCSALTAQAVDEVCAAPVEETCQSNPAQSKCCTSAQKWDGAQCVNKTLCEMSPNDCACNPAQAKCCDAATQKWDGAQCVKKTLCEISPNDCACNPAQAKCCDAATQKWSGSACIAKTACERSDQKNTCACETYKLAHKCQCEPNAANCCNGKCMTYANGVCTKKSCPSGKQLNEENCLCESTCTPSKSEWVSAESSVKDTCNGNAVDEYACFSGEEKTCVDVRTTTTTIGGGSRPCNDGECLQWSGDKCLVVCGHYDITAPTINPGGSSSGPGQLQDTIIGGGNVGWSGGTIAYKEKRTVTCCGFKTAWKPGIGGDIQFVPIK